MVLTVPDIPTIITAEKPADGNSPVVCYLCGAKVALKNMRNYVGHHIMYSMRDVPDVLLKGEDVDVSVPGAVSSPARKAVLTLHNGILGSGRTLWVLRAGRQVHHTADEERWNGEGCIKLPIPLQVHELHHCRKTYEDYTVYQCTHPLPSLSSLPLGPCCHYLEV